MLHTGVTTRCARYKQSHVVCTIQAERVTHRFSHHVCEHGQASVAKRLLRGPRPVNLRPTTHTHAPAHTRTHISSITHGHDWQERLGSSDMQTQLAP